MIEEKWVIGDVLYFMQYLDYGEDEVIELAPDEIEGNFYFQFPMHTVKANKDDVLTITREKVS